MTRRSPSSRAGVAELRARFDGHVRTRFYPLRYPNLSLGAGCHIRGRLTIVGGGSVILGDRVYVDDAAGPVRIYVAAGGRVEIGDDCYVNGLAITAQADVIIGRRCLLGDALIATTNHHSSSRDRHSNSSAPKVAPVRLGENVWLAGRSVVLPGVTVGDDSVVTIGSVIHEDVPPGCVASSHQQRVVARVRES